MLNNMIHSDPTHSVPKMSTDSVSFIDEAVASGYFTSREAAIDEAIRLLRQEIQHNGSTPPTNLTADEWCDRLDSWAASHRTLAHEADDSRESIYAGRGE